jgi:hypothetical protein
VVDFISCGALVSTGEFTATSVMIPSAINISIVIYFNYRNSFFLKEILAIFLRGFLIVL